MWERLDRVLVSADWFVEFLDFSVESEVIAASDHSPLIVTLQNKIPWRRRPYRFEAAWLHGNACSNIVTQVWNGSLRARLLMWLLTKIRLS